MNKISIVMLIIWIAVAAGLIALLVIGLSTKSFFNIFNGKIGINGMTVEELKGNYNEVTYCEYEDVDEFNISWIAGNVTVKPTDGDKVKVTEYCQRELKDGEKMKVETSGSLISIDFKTDNNLFNMPPKLLVIEIPNGKADEIEINTVSADVIIETITSEEMKIATTSGDINGTISADKIDFASISGDIAAEISAEKTKISTTSGSTSIISDERLDELKFDSISGKIKLDAAKCPKEANINTTSGNIEIILPPDSQFTLDYDKISGDLTNDFPTPGNGDCELEISTISGDLTIKSK